jgi:CheY-like chemotaxis protein
MTAPDDEPIGAPLEGLRVLVVEDEMMIAMMLEDLLDGFGCRIVGPAADITKALALIAAEAIDGAMLDVNLAGRAVDPVADELARLGIPFIFVTGYGRRELQENHNSRPTLAKPFRRLELQRIMTATFAPTADTNRS